MKTAMLTLVILVGLIATVHCACTVTEAVTCASTQETDLSAAGTDVGKLCSAYKKYLTCLTDAGCGTDATYKTFIDAANTYINDSCNSGVMATASVLTMSLTLFMMLFK